MAVPQPGIFAQGTRSHYHLEFDVLPGASNEQISAAIGGLREPAVTVGGSNIVVGFGADLARRLLPDDVPADLQTFPGVNGPAGEVPSTPHDIWVWTHGTGEDVELDIARAIHACFAPVATLAAEQPGFVYQDSRDLTGFIDGTENPPVEEAHDVAIVADGPGAGGSHVIAARFVHDLAKFHSRDLTEQQDTIGRTKPDSVELDPLPATSHIGRVQIEEDGEELEIYRRSVPFGRVSEMGLFFVAFSADPTRYLKMLDRMYGTTGEGVHDHLMDFTRPVSGAFYFAPSLDALAGILPGDRD
jgi:putative iron-dependent peroxidase